MAKKQTRRSVSMNVALFRVLKEHCKNTGYSVSHFVSECISDKLKAQGVELPSGLGNFNDSYTRMIRTQKAQETKAWLHRPNTEDNVRNPCRREGCSIEYLHEIH